MKGIVRLKDASDQGFSTSILNYAFGRWELTPYPSLDGEKDLEGVSLRLTIMGERGEVGARARRFAESLKAEVK